MAASAPPAWAEPADELHRALQAAPPIVCFANDYHGDPTSKHHIMRTYANYSDVLWVESSGMRRPRLRRTRDVRRIAVRLARAVRGLRREQPRLHVLSPFSIPSPGSPVATWLNGVLYRRIITGALADLNWHRAPLLWVFAPTVAPHLAKLPHTGIIYHCVDRWWEFPDYDPEVMAAAHAQLCRAADVVFASAAALHADCLRHTTKAFLVPHGVDWEHFARAAISPPRRPGDIEDWHGPILGFFGLIHEWVDQDLIVRVAAAFPQAMILLIGQAQVDVSRLHALRNIRLLGQRSYARLPAYAAAFDVGLIPFVFNELTAAVNPIKLREYLSAGVPVVASALPEIRQLGDLPHLRTAQTADEFIAGIRHFLSLGRDPAARRATAQMMAAESWAGRCATMARLMREHVRL